MIINNIRFTPKAIALIRYASNIAEKSDFKLTIYAIINL